MKQLKKVEVYKSFYVLAFIMVALGYIEQFFIMLLLVFIHEGSHLLVARYYEIQTEGLIVTPIGLIGKIKSFDFLPTVNKAMITMAGPTSNLVMFLGSWLLFPDKYIFFRSVNLALFVFNLLPVYPLDGGRLFQILFNNLIGITRTNKQLLRISRVLGFLFVLAGLVQVSLYPFNISLLSIGVYICCVNKKGSAHMQMDIVKIFIFQKNKEKSDILPVKTYVAFEDTIIKDVLDLFCFNYYYMVHIIENGISKAVLTEKQIIDYVLDFGAGDNLGNVSNSVK